MQKLKKSLPALIIVVLLSIVSTMDYNDQLAQQAHYCEMTKTGHWPAFKNMECDL